MSQQLISRSADLKRLQDEGYNLEIRSGLLLVKEIPYANSNKAIERGTLVSKLVLTGDVTGPPDDHVAYFVGEYPCHESGREIEQIKNQSAKLTLAEGTVIDHTFSAKPKPTGNYEDYYAKVSTYVAIISGPAQAIDPNVTAKTFPVIEPEKSEGETIFNYIDTASSRAEINAISVKVALEKIAIVGLGGTGAYVLDLVTKTPVKEIHIFDGDSFLQHNAFRSPGAPSIMELRAKPQKTDYFKNLYSKMHRGIIGHGTYLDAGNVEELEEMKFVFLCLDRGAAKQIIVEKLKLYGVPFVDVGMGVYVSENSLGGTLRITSSTPNQHDHTAVVIPFSDGEGHNEYARNIQIADLNALNAALAVVKWKKLFGFYLDLEYEHHSTYTIDGNKLDNAYRRS